MSYFVEDLLSSIKRRSFAPISQSTFVDDDIISLANEELDLNLVSDLVTQREDFFLTTEDKPLVAGNDHYQVPSRAIGNTLKTLFYIDSSAYSSRLELVDPSRSGEYSGSSAQPSAFYFEGDEVVLVPSPSTSIGFLRFQFPAKPNQLISTSLCAKITSVTGNDPRVSFSVNNDLTTTLSVGSIVDIVSSQSPFKTLTYRAVITQITSALIEVSLSSVLDSAGLNIKPQVGDYICPTGYSNIPQIPTSHFPVLAQMVAVRMLESLGDLNKLSKAQETLAVLEKKSTRLIQNRVETSPKRISTRKSLVRFFR